jgi:hypothetical protein
VSEKAREKLCAGGSFCINKSNSTEVGETINSMFRWYKNAAVCYAYLSDVPAASFRAPYTEFKASRWFKRGWTLQELIASRDVLFLSADWTFLGSKGVLRDVIREITKVNQKALDNTPLSHFSIAERMSWAASRQTTRVEDRAYSLMDMFEVHMTLLYGEKEQAFSRLQQEIMKVSDDQSLFAWKDPSLSAEQYVGLLARSPDSFVHSTDFHSLGIFGRRDEFRITNQGLSISFYMIPHQTTEGLYYLSLECGVGGSVVRSPALILKWLGNSNVIIGKNDFARIHANDIEILEGSQKGSGSIRSIYVRHDVAITVNRLQNQPALIRFHITKAHTGEELSVFPMEGWNPQNRTLSVPPSTGKLGGIAFTVKYITVVSVFGISQARVPWMYIETIERARLEDYWLSYTPSGQEPSSLP